jgi:hypothetical protein
MIVGLSGRLERGHCDQEHTVQCMLRTARYGEGNHEARYCLNPATLLIAIQTGVNLQASYLQLWPSWVPGEESHEGHTNLGEHFIKLGINDGIYSLPQQVSPIRQVWLQTNERFLHHRMQDNVGPGDKQSKRLGKRVMISN